MVEERCGHHGGRGEDDLQERGIAHRIRPEQRGTRRLRGQALRVDAATAEPSAGIIRRAAGYTAVSLAKGVVDTGQTAYGLADASTSGAIDRASNVITEDAGNPATKIGDKLTGGHVGESYREGDRDGGPMSQGFNQANQQVDELYSREQQSANRRVAEAFDKEGSIPGIAEATKNPTMLIRHHSKWTRIADESWKASPDL